MKYPKNGETNWIALNYNGSSLRDVIGNGAFQATNVNATEWKKLLNNSDIQVKSKRSNILSWLCINFPSCSKTPVRTGWKGNFRIDLHIIVSQFSCSCCADTLKINLSWTFNVRLGNNNSNSSKKRQTHAHAHTHTYKKKAIKNRSGRSVNIQNTCFFRFIPRPFRENTYFFFLDEG